MNGTTYPIASTSTQTLMPAQGQGQNGHLTPKAQSSAGDAPNQAQGEAQEDSHTVTASEEVQHDYEICNHLVRPPAAA